MHNFHQKSHISNSSFNRSTDSISPLFRHKYEHKPKQARIKRKVAMSNLMRPTSSFSYQSQPKIRNSILKRRKQKIEINLSTEINQGPRGESFAKLTPL